MLQEKRQWHRSSRRVLPKVGQLGFRPSTFLALGIAALPTSWRALLHGYQRFSLNRNGISSRTLAWKKSTRREELWLWSLRRLSECQLHSSALYLKWERGCFGGLKGCISVLLQKVLPQSHRLLTGCMNNTRRLKNTYSIFKQSEKLTIKQIVAPEMLSVLRMKPNLTS